MIDLQNSMISLRSAGIKFTAEYLFGDLVLFHLDAKPYSYDLSIGRVFPHDWETDICHQTLKGAYGEYHPSYMADGFNWLSDEEKIAQLHRWVIDHQDELHLAATTPEVLSVILAFASHQVKGDDLIKGLKAMGLQMPTGTKIISLNTGGWKITFPYKDDIFHSDVETFALCLLDPIA